MCKQRHTPVLLQEVLTMLAPQKGGTLLDLTVGYGGHFEHLKKAVGDDGVMWGVDQDLSCVERLKGIYPECSFVHGHWMHALSVIKDHVDNIDGVLMDCGVSSMQLDDPDRGFSFRFNGPLDMRMNPTQGPTVKACLERLSEKDLADIIYQLGEERRSRAIAKSIVQARKQKKMNTTFDLVDAVEKAVGPKKGKRHPATQTFQALRMHVNQELDLISQALDFLVDHLSPHARIAVITFHSLEDRLVKHRFRDFEKQNKLKRLNKKAMRPQRSEILSNPRSRSAILRGVQIRQNETDL